MSFVRSLLQPRAGLGPWQFPVVLSLGLKEGHSSAVPQISRTGHDSPCARGFGGCFRLQGRSLPQQMQSAESPAAPAKSSSMKPPWGSASPSSQASFIFPELLPRMLQIPPSLSSQTLHRGKWALNSQTKPLDIIFFCLFPPAAPQVVVIIIIIIIYHKYGTIVALVGSSIALPRQQLINPGTVELFLTPQLLSTGQHPWDKSCPSDPKK